ncbi:V-type ATP synthase subunit F [Clostridia bacterium]|nr:V-type ATP synthase subunit F [Clostridia bacterium]
MNENSGSGKIAVIGDKDCVLAFQAVGAEVFAETDPYKVRDVLKKLAREGYSVILIAEEQAAEAHDLIKRFSEDAYPVILPIPGGSGAAGSGLAALRENMIRAIGADLL